LKKINVVYLKDK